MLSCFSLVRPCAALCTVACQTPLSMGFSRQEYWSRLPCPPPENPNPGIEPTSLTSPALAGPTSSLSLAPPGKPQFKYLQCRETFLNILPPWWLFKAPWALDQIFWWFEAMSLPVYLCVSGQLPQRPTSFIYIRIMSFIVIDCTGPRHPLALTDPSF